MRRLLILSALLTAACTGTAIAPAVGGSGAAPVGVYASANVSAKDLSGQWIIGGSRAEPPAGGLVACGADQILTLTQTGVRLQGSLDACGGLCTKQEQLDGTNHDGDVQLQGTGDGNLGGAAADNPVGNTKYDLSYILTYNPKTQHLVGKRLEQPFWAVPLVRPSCAPSTTPAPVAS
ncbi:MAG: hypothetical protein JWM80_2690 [Cyanobacteria bacterium RYN_339]|nr:hypothetical protein [Cyanobacteria bacterium RYN_339]